MIPEMKIIFYQLSQSSFNYPNNLYHSKSVALISIILLMMKNGCYGQSVSNDKSEQYELPLRSLTYDIQLADSIACLQLSQHYYNASSSILDVQYIFPINPQAAIIKFQVQFGQTQLRGIVKEKEEANKQYNQNKKQGVGVAYGEINEKSRDLMRVKLGNVGVNQNVKIKLTFAHEVNISYNTFYEFRLSPTMTPRYVSNLPAENISFNKFNSGKPIKGCQWNMRILVKSMRKLQSFFSPSHSIGPNAKEIDQFTSEILITEPALRPDRDFSLCYTFEFCNKPNYLLNHNDNCTIAAVSFIPNLCPLVCSEAKNHIQNSLPYPVSLSHSKAEYIFMLDRSGSMDGTRIQQAKKSLIIFLKSLPEDSYFNVISFGTHYFPMFNKSQKNDLSSIEKAILEVQKMDARLGGTQIQEALRWIFNQNLHPGYPQQLFLLTDGAVEKTKSVIKLVGENIHHARVHCIGIGNGCSEALINGCAKKGRGYSIFISDKEDPSPLIISLLQKSLSPVISKMKLSYNRSKVESIVPNPDKIPYILKNDLANFYIQFKEILKVPFPIQIQYEDSIGSKFKESVEINPQNALQCSFISTMANFKRIRALQDLLNGQEQQDHLYYVKKIDKKDLQQQIIKESIDNQVLTDLTAFVCVNINSSDQLNKANLGYKKKNINIKPMNPADHFTNVQFYSENDEEDPLQACCMYVNQCCIQIIQQAPPQNKIVEKKITQKKNRAIPMFTRDSANDKTAYINGVNLEKTIQLNQDLKIIKSQQVNGSWISRQILSSLYIKKDIDGLDQQLMKSYNKNVTKEPFWITFLVIKYIQKMLKGHAEFSMILKKAQEFISKSMNKAHLEDIYGKIFQKQ